MAISIVVWIRFVLTVAFGTVAFGTVAFGMACPTTPAVAGNQDLGELVQMLESGDALTCEQALKGACALGPAGPNGIAAVDVVCRHRRARSLQVRSMTNDALVAVGAASVEPLKPHLSRHLRKRRTKPPCQEVSMPSKRSQFENPY